MPIRTERLIALLNASPLFGPMYVFLSFAMNKGMPFERGLRLAEVL